MKKKLPFLKRLPRQVFLLFFTFFAMSLSAQTTLVEYNFNNANVWSTPNTLDAAILTTPTLKYWRPTGSNNRIELTPNFDNGRLVAFQENDYIELEINTVGYSSLNLSFNLKLLGRGFVAGGSWNVTYNSGSGWAGNGGVTGTTWFLNQTDDKTYNQPLPGDFSTVNPLLIRITAADWNILGSASLQLDNLKLTYGNPNITLYSDTNVVIPNTASASEAYNTVYGNRETLITPGEFKTYRVRNFNGNSGSVLNVTSVQIEPAAGTTANDFVVTGSSNITGLIRVASSTSSTFGAVTIQFIPQAEGVRSAVVKVYSNGAPSPYSFTVIGGGRSCNISNTAYVQNTMDPALIQTLPSDLQNGDYAVGDNKNHSNILGGTTNVIYPSPSSGTYPLNTTNPAGSKSSWLTGGNSTIKTREFGGSSGIDISNLRNVSVEFNVAAFANSNANNNNTKGVTTDDYVILSILDNGTWKEVMQLNGSNNTSNSNRRKYAFNPTGRVFTKNYDLSLTTESNSDNSTTSTNNNYARSRFKFNIPLEVSKDITNFKFQIRAKANADAVWLIDDVRITSDNANYKRWDGTNWKSWDGTKWITSTRPNPKEKAVFDGDYDFGKKNETTNLDVCECEINADKTLNIPAGKVLTVKGKVTNNGTGPNFVLASDANLIQIEPGENNTGNITVVRNVTDMNNISTKMDYVYWSSPVLGQQTKGAGGFSPGTPNNMFFTYRESNDRFYETGDPTFIPGKGYAVRAESGLPDGYSKDYKFTGVPNNGDYKIAITRSPDTGPTVHGYNLIGNPYPSNINFDQLFANNGTLIYKTVWFWTNNTFTSTQQGSGYVGNNYAVYNATGGNHAPMPVGVPYSTAPNGIIKVGQGFLVQKQNYGSDSLVFKNSYGASKDLRVSTSGTFYQKSSEGKNRFWLKLISPDDMVNTQLIGYIDGATDAFEMDYDAEAFGMSSNLFYSILEDKHLLIQGKSSQFSVDDRINLGANFFQNSNYTIELEQAEGIFANGQSIYLKDKLTGSITNLSQGSYTFEANKGVTNARFEIIYKPETVLVTDSKVKDAIVVYRDSDHFVVKAPKIIATVEVYDLSGKMITVLKANSNLAVLNAAFFTKGMYVLRIKTIDGEITNKKIVKQ